MLRRADRRSGGGRRRRLKKSENRPVEDIIVLETFTKELTVKYLAEVRIIRLVVVILLRSNMIEISRERFW